MSQRILVLFNLKDGVSREDYEAWATSTDIPGVNGLGSVDRFEVFRSEGLLFSDDPAPYEYFEVLDINDMDRFGEEAGTEAMTAIANTFQTEMAKDIAFINTSPVK